MKEEIKDIENIEELKVEEIKEKLSNKEDKKLEKDNKKCKKLEIEIEKLKNDLENK